MKSLRNVNCQKEKQKINKMRIVRLDVFFTEFAGLVVVKFLISNHLNFSHKHSKLYRLKVPRVK